MEANRDFIDLICSYGATSQNSSSYDEQIQKQLKKLSKSKFKPFELPNPYLDESKEDNLFKLLDEKNEAVFLISGCAGDGKTFLLRQLWSRINGNYDGWSGNNILKCNYFGKKCIFVRDLSSVIDQSDEHKDLINLLIGIYTGNVKNNLLFIATNDGQIIEKLKHAEFLNEIKAQVSKELLNKIEAFFIDRKRINDRNLIIRDLRNICNRDYIKQAFNVVLNHEQWSVCKLCTYCNDCPLLINRQNFLNPTFQEQVLNLLTIAVCDGYHLTTRNLLLLISNIICGVELDDFDERKKLNKSQKNVVTCGNIEEFIKKNSVNTFDNVFGFNFGTARFNKEIFRFMSSFKIGEESSKKLELFLNHGEEIDKYKENYNLFKSAQPHLTKIFRSSFKSYLERSDFSGAVTENVSNYERLLQMQRRRLFFSFDSDLNKLENCNIWDLTVYKNADAYLNLLNILPTNSNENKYTRSPEYQKIFNRLIIGLNYYFTGLFSSEDGADVLYVTQSGTFSNSKINVINPISFSKNKKSTNRIYLERSNDLDKLPMIVVKCGNLDNKETFSEYLKLTPSIFEFLYSISHGIMPSTFSAQSAEKVLNFKLKILSLLSYIEKGKNEDPMDIDSNLSILTLENGKLDEESLLEV